MLTAIALILTLAVVAGASSVVWLAGRHDDEVLQRVSVLGREGRVQDALTVAHALEGATAAVVIAGLSQATEDDAEIAMAQARREQHDSVRPYVSTLDHIAFAGVILAGAAALGLLVVLTRMELGVVDQLMDGLAAEVMLAAASLGLTVAITATLGRFWLLSRLRRLAIDMEKAAVVVYNTAR